MIMLNAIYKMIAVATGCLLLLTGCEKDGLVEYTGGDSVGFWTHSINHSLYGATVSELPRDTIVLNLSITGELRDYDRLVTAACIPDKVGTAKEDLKNTAVEGKDYNLLGGVVKANEASGKYRIEIINNDFLKANELKLNLGLEANEDFEVGLQENSSIAIVWSQRIMQPATWSAMRFFFCATYSTQVYKVFMQATGLKEFYYYEDIVSAEEATVMGRNFGNIIRAYEKEHGTKMLHDDGAAAGTPIIPIH